MPGNFHEVPASVIATWPKPQYDHPDIERMWMPEFGGIFLGVTTLLVGSRFYLRVRREAGDFGLDDLLIGIAWLFAVGLTTVAFIDAGWYGLSRHTWDVRLGWYSGAALMGWIAQVFFLISTCATKCSVLLFYRRMVKDTGQWIYAIWAALGLTGAYFLGILLAYCLICQPLDAYWLSYDFSYDKPFKCVDGTALSLCVGILSVISDLYAVILPFVILRHYELDVPRRQRIGLNVIFGLGILVAGAGIARTYYLYKINHTYDTSWAGFDLFVWSLVECHLAIICACAPSLRAFVRRYLGDAFNRTFRSSSYSRSRSRSRQDAKNSQLEFSTTQRNSHLPPEQTKRVSTIDERALAKESVEDPFDGPFDSRSRGWSQESGPQINSAEDYEAYAMKQLSRHAYKRSNTADSMAYEQPPDPRRQHDLENARSWLSDR